MDFLFSDAHCHLESICGEIETHILYITSGYSHKSNLRNAQIAEKYPNVFLCAGIAPQEAMKHREIKIRLAEWEEAIANFPKLAAIGEIGLDYHWAKSDEERFLQHECFISQLALAERMSLPVVIHSRDAERECLDILSNFNLPFMLHCFSGKKEDAEIAANGKGVVSIPPIRSKERKKIIKDLPLEKLLAESDAPYIGKTPHDAMASIKMIAEIKELEEETVRKATLANTVSFFKIR